MSKKIERLIKKQELEKEFKKEFLSIPKGRQSATIEKKVILIHKMIKAGFTYSEIGRIMEYKDHTTPRHLHKSRK